MKVIGLAGETGCGKSSVACELACREGIVWVDLDRLAWETYRPRTPTYWRLVSRFGKEIIAPDGTVDRSRLARIVFSDSQAWEDLNAIVHPALNKRLREIISAHKSQGIEILLVEGALLASSPHVDRSLFDAILWLDAKRSVREERLRSAGRSYHIGRGFPHPSVTQAIRIDASGSIAATAQQILQTIASL